MAHRGEMTVSQETAQEQSMYSRTKTVFIVAMFTIVLCVNARAADSDYKLFSIERRANGLKLSLLAMVESVPCSLAAQKTSDCR
jgi:hypothetical protein